MKYSAAVTGARLGPRIPELFAPKFTYSLGGEPDSFTWEFIPEGEVWNYTREGAPMVADEDLVKLVTFRERSIIGH
jgi:hypothetical protein